MEQEKIEELTNGAQVNGHAETNGHVNAETNGHVNAENNGHANAETNGHVDAEINGHVNGETNGHVNGGSQKSVSPDAIQLTQIQVLPQLRVGIIPPATSFTK